MFLPKSKSFDISIQEFLYCKIDLQEITYQSKNWVYQIMHRKDRVAKSVEFVSRERKCACARAHLEVTFALQPAE